MVVVAAAAPAAVAVAVAVAVAGAGGGVGKRRGVAEKGRVLKFYSYFGGSEVLLVVRGARGGGGGGGRGRSEMECGDHCDKSGRTH